MITCAQNKKGPIELAWRFNPLLAVRVAERFQGVDVAGRASARRTIGRLLRADPSQSADVPELVPMLLEREFFNATPRVSTSRSSH